VSDLAKKDDELAVEKKKAQKNDDRVREIQVKLCSAGFYMSWITTRMLLPAGGPQEEDRAAGRRALHESNRRRLAAGTGGDYPAAFFSRSLQLSRPATGP
jgi:hypothetical protein